MEENIFGQAQWIWPDNPHWDLFNCYALFRTAFTLGSLPRRAPLFITADESYQLFINGRFVARGPARGFQVSWPYDEVDVRAWLKPGRNVIAVRAYNPGCSSFRYVFQGFAGLLVAARWGDLRLASGPHWKGCRQKGTRRHTVPRSIQLLDAQEHIDLRHSTHGWHRPSYDDRDWGSPEARVWNSLPWVTLESRGIPLLREETCVFGKLIGVGAGRCAPGHRNCDDVVALRLRERRGHRPASSGETFPVIRATGRRRFQSYLFDFGRTVVGNLFLRTDGASAGTAIDTHYAETINPATLALDQHEVSHSRLALGERLVLRAGKNEHAFFHPNGFRYVELTVRDSLNPMRVRPELRWVGYPFRRLGRFTTSDAELSRIWETCVWTQQCCSLDAYIDTPWREQAQWWGDARVQAWNTFHLDGDARLLRRGIRQIASQTTPDGVTYGHAPTIAHNCILPDFTLVWLLSIWDYYWQTGSNEPFRTHKDTIDRALDYFARHTSVRHGLVEHDPRFWLFLDWSELPREGASAVYNLWLLVVLQKLAKLYRLDRSFRRARKLDAWASRLRRSLARLVDHAGLVHDGFDSHGRIYPTRSIHAQTLSALVGLDGFSDCTALEQVVLPWMRGEKQPPAIPSVYWVTYVFDWLRAAGHGTEVVDFIRHHWAAMAEHGTTWENYAPRRGEESHSHAWSAHPLFHLMRIIGGVVQTAPAWKRIRFVPHFIGTQGGATIPSPAGHIVSRWRREPGGKVAVEIRLPKGVSADVCLPGRPSATVTGTRSWSLATIRDGAPLGVATNARFV